VAKQKIDWTTRYAQDVTNGKILAGRMVRQACLRHLNDLKDGKKRGLHFDVEAADRVFEFFSTLRLTEGQHDGKPFLLQPSQKFIIGSIFGWKVKDGTRRFRTAYVETGKGPLALDTPVATPTGWTTMGEIRVGDHVLTPGGRPTEVLGVSHIFTNHQCFRVTFDDGESLVADAQHRWYTEMRKSDGHAMRGVARHERGKWRKGIRTTEEIAATLRYKNGQYQSANHSIPLSDPLELPDAVLPVEPYTLGAWLGDGDSDGARITVHDDDREILSHLLAAGTHVGDRGGKKPDDTQLAEFGRMVCAHAGM
jgi:hypothetical protein